MFSGFHQLFWCLIHYNLGPLLSHSYRKDSNNS